MSYDDVSHRIADAFRLKKAAPTSSGSGPFDGIVSPEWGSNPMTTMAYDRPITLIAWYEHADNDHSPGLLITTPKSGEYPWLSDRVTGGSFNSPNNTNVNVSHTAFDTGHEKHWEAYAIRNLVTPTNNWVITHVPLDRALVNFDAPASNSTSNKSANGAISTTRFELYKSRFSQYGTTYHWETNLGPWLCLDTALEDRELFDIAGNPWPYLRKYWDDILFLVSPLSGEDFGPRRWNFEATYSPNSSSDVVGYVPYLDYSAGAVRGVGYRPYFFASTFGSRSFDQFARAGSLSAQARAPTSSFGYSQAVTAATCQAASVVIVEEHGHDVGIVTFGLVQIAGAGPTSSIGEVFLSAGALVWEAPPLGDVWEVPINA